MTAWSALPTTDVDADSPGDTDLADALIARDLHLREFLTGSTPRYNDRTPHDHSGVGGDAVVHAVASQNLIQNPCPDGSDYWWTLSGFSAHGATQTLTGGTGAGNHAYQRIGYSYELNSAQTALFGDDGSPLVGSLFIKAAGSVPTTGTMFAGFADGSTSSYETGHRWSIAASDVTTSWKRVWFFSDDSTPAVSWPFSGNTTDNRFLISMDSTPFDNAVLLTGFQVVQSLGQLTPFNWGPGEIHAALLGRIHSANRQPKAPVWSTPVAMTNAVELTTRA